MMHYTEKESERCVGVERKNAENESFWEKNPTDFLSKGKI